VRRIGLHGTAGDTACLHTRPFDIPFFVFGAPRLRATLGDYYEIFERWLNGGRWTFSCDLVTQEGTGRRSGLLQNGDVCQVSAAEDGEAKLRDNLPT